MFAVYAEHLSCSGDSHEDPVALFDTKEAAMAFRVKLEEKYPEGHFTVGEWALLPINPTSVEEIF